MIYIIDCGSTKTPFFSEIISQFNLASKTIKLADITPFQTTEHDKIIISGAPILLTQVDQAPYLEKFQFLKALKQPVLGVCFGHQILGLLHGARAFKCDEDRDWQNIQVHDHKELFKDFEPQVQMKQDHTECIDLPNDFICTASSVVCSVEAMRHAFKPFYGVQFHPEISEYWGAALIKNFVNL